MPVSERDSCSSPASQRTASPARIGTRSPSPPLTQPAPRTTAKSWRTAAGWRPTTPPGPISITTTCACGASRRTIALTLPGAVTGRSPPSSTHLKRSEALEHACDRLAEADAHRGHAVAGLSALELVDEGRRDARPGGAERVAERDPASAGVHVVHPLLEPGVADELEDDRRERLVDLDHGDVVPTDPGPLERTVAGLRVAVQHAVRVDPRQPEGDEARAGLEAELRGLPLARDQDSGRAVADLARAPGGHLALRQERRLQRSQGLEGRVPPRRLVDREERAGMRILNLDRHDLVLEAALVDGRDRPPVGLERERVQLLAREPPLFGDRLCRHPLRDDLPALEQLVREIAAIRPHRNARHHLHAAGNDEVELSGPDRRRRVEVRLHRRAALPVDRRSRDRLRPAGDERHHPSDVPALLADLGDAAELDVLDLARIDLVAPEEPVQDLARELVA